MTAPNPELIDLLPIGYTPVEEVPESLARTVFEALRLEVLSNKTHHRVTYRITLVGQTAAVTYRAARQASVATPNRIGTTGRGGAGLSLAAERDHRGPICVAPPAGHDIDGNGTDQHLLAGRLVIEADFVLSSRR
ncbi:hypothetical protein [Nocardia sp. NBC_00511]|uniref:hypothetical protein n=1 Tax=Nocardia sp. NBC_00511 TaxID=2903591 RepID=UPI0030E40E37